MSNRHPANPGPRVSVVIPVYNAVPWLKTTLASVVSQTYPHELLDIIVVDDGSTDASSEVTAESLRTSDIAYRVFRVPNGGPSRARNLGWSASSADWIQFLDADDLIAPNKIEAQIRATGVLDPEVGVVYSDWESIVWLGGEWTQGEARTPVLNADTIAELLESDRFIHSGSCLFRRANLDRVGGFDERHWLIEDVDLYLRIAMAGGEFHHVSGTGPVFCYRQHEGSLSRRDQAAFHEGCIRNALLVENHWRLSAQLTEFRAWRLANIYHQGARYFVATNRHRFEELVRHIEMLLPGFLPDAPALLRNTSRLIGYRRAEILSIAYRRVKAFCRANASGPVERRFARPPRSPFVLSAPPAAEPMLKGSRQP